ncbi:MAG: cyclic nucleotide-binding domain-containing protein [Oligoflexia bacterium]|nr:cyclic nucleotide-binding domain-containing protein [Oligoflexia bacterium]
MPKEIKNFDWSLLKKFALINQLSDHKLELIAKEIKLYSFEANEIICSEESISESMFFINSGKIKITKSEVVLATLKAGDYFGEMSLLEKKTRNASASVIENAEVFELHSQTFDSFIKSSPEALYNVALTFDHRLRENNNMVVKQYLELKNQFVELQEAHRQLLQTDKLASIGMITAGVAHEINNPLTILNGYIQMLRTEFPKKNKTDEYYEKTFLKLEHACEAIKKIVIGLKTYVRMDEDHTVPIKLHETIQGSIDLVSFLYKKEHIELMTEFDMKDPNVEVMGNVGQLQQVIINLLSNAKDAMDGRENKKITLRTKVEDDYILVDVSDNGQGITDENLKKLFKKFFTTKGVGKGTGLGLDIVRSIVDKMKGDIKVNSTLNIGTTFTIKVPRIKKDE